MCPTSFGVWQHGQTRVSKCWCPSPASAVASPRLTASMTAAPHAVDKCRLHYFGKILIISNLLTQCSPRNFVYPNKFASSDFQSSWAQGLLLKNGMSNAKSYQSPVDQSCHFRRNAPVGTNAKSGEWQRHGLLWPEQTKFAFWMHIRTHHRQKKLLESSVSMEENGSLYVHTLLQRLIILGYTTGECESGKEF